MSDILRLRLSRAPQRQINRNILVPDQVQPPPDGGVVATPRSRTTKKKGQPSKLPFFERLLADPKRVSQIANAFMRSRSFVGGGVPLGVPLREFDEWLVEHDNLAPPDEVTKALEQLAVKRLAILVRSVAWLQVKRNLFDSLIASLLSNASPAVRCELARLLLVAGLVEELAVVPSALKTASDVENALRYRTVVLPPELLQLIPRKARLARRYGFADLYVVRDEWNRYEAGEIAHIENVLPYESKKRTLSTLSETEVTTVVESETTDTEEHDSQTTDRMELQQHAQSETDLAVHVAAQVDVQASYGSMQISASVGGSFDYSQKNAEDHAFQQSHEMVTRAVKRVEQQVKTSRTTRSLQRTTEENKHALDNKSGQSVVGIYRWVDKVQRLQLFRYPHRLLLEFEIPEPAAYLTWRRKQPRGEFLTPEPVDLVRRDATKGYTPITDLQEKTSPLLATDITKDTYQWWVAQYNVTGALPPPADRVKISTFLELKEAVPSGGGGGGNFGSTVTTDDSIVDKTYFDLIAPGGGDSTQPGVAIPAGYRLLAWGAAAYAANVIALLSNATPVYYQPDIDVTVGLQAVRLTRQGPGTIDVWSDLRDQNFTLNGPSPKTWRFSGAVASTAYPSNDPVTGVVPVTARVTTSKECRLHVTLDCVLADNSVAVLQWQQQTYELVSQAYWALKRQRADEQAAQATGAGVEIKGDSPARNKEVILEELKRGVIEMLTGDNFKGRNAMKLVANGQPPEVNLDSAITTAEEIQFIEQAFEWENLTYVLYPYFWGKYERWPELADVTGADEDFARFVRSGSARVVVPARPKFENQVCAYVDFGVLWGGGPVPTVNDPDYLSVAAEIMAQQLPPDDGEKRRSWEVRLPTTLVWLDNDSTLPKINPHPVLDAPPGQAANTTVIPAPPGP